MTILFILTFPAFALCPVTSEFGMKRVQMSGKSVYAHFTKHPYGESEDFWQALREDSKPKIEAKLRQLVESRRALVTSLRSDHRALTKLLKKREIQWLGIEASPREMRRGRSPAELVHDYNELKSLLEGTFSKTLSDDLLTLLYPSYVRIMAEQPDLVRGIRLEPLDDDQAKDESSAILERRLKARKSLIDIGMKGGFPFEKFKKVDALNTLALSRNQPLSESEISSALSGVTSPAAIAGIRAFVKETNDFLRQAALRDVTASNNIVRLQGNGYVSMGTSHGPGILRRLDSVCAERGSSAAEATR